MEPIVTEGMITRVKKLASLVQHHPSDSQEATAWVNRIHDLAELVANPLSPGDLLRNFEEFQVKLLGWRNKYGS